MGIKHYPHIHVEGDIGIEGLLPLHLDDPLWAHHPFPGNVEKVPLKRILTFWVEEFDH